MIVILIILPFILSLTGLVLGIISLKRCDKAIREAENKLAELEKKMELP